jgi:hypothetical protein
VSVSLGIKKPRRCRRGLISPRGGSERLDAGRKPRQLARNGVPVKNTLGHAALHLGLGFLEGLSGGGLVAGRDGGFDLLDEGANAADPGAIDGSAPLGLADTFLCGLVISHN